MERPRDATGTRGDPAPHRADADPAGRKVMRRAAEGDPDAVREIVERFQGPLLDLGVRILRDRGEAEDLSQEVFLRVWKEAANFKATGSLKGWVFRIASNLALNRLRRARLPLAPEPDAGPGAGLDPSERLAARERARAVREAVESLPETQRLAVVLLRFEGLSYGEIAQALDLSGSAAASLIHRAHEALREKLRGLAR
jgi:RNA polymerase sigma-70 factor (ECF subfamily)